MEFFLELASTFAVTFLLCYFIGKLVSSSPDGDTKNDRDRKIRAHELSFRVEPAVGDSEIEERFETVEKVEGHEELLGNFSVEEFVNGREVEESNEEKEASKEKLVEQESHGGNGGFFGGERGNIGEIEACSSNNEEMRVSKCECEEKGEDCVKEVFSFDEEEDDWVGIERNELERLFGEALVFVGSKSNSNKVSGIENDLKMKLYGLQKIATQGPCLEPQPMALKVSARAKWNAWQQLGEMTPEMAMEQYIWLLSENVPGWTRDGFNGDGKKDFVGAGEERLFASKIKIKKRKRTSVLNLLDFATYLLFYAENMKNLRLIIEGIDVIYVRVQTHQSKQQGQPIIGAFVPCCFFINKVTCFTTVDDLISDDEEMKEEGFKDS